MHKPTSGRRRRRASDVVARFAGFALLTGLATIAAPMAPAASTPSPRPVPASFRASVQAAVDDYLAHQPSSIASARSAGGFGPQATCFEFDDTDATGDPDGPGGIDLSAVTLSTSCGTFWTVRVSSTNGGWESRLVELDVLLDADDNIDNGCDGWERLVAVVLTDTGLLNLGLDVHDCDTLDVTDVLPVGRDGLDLSLSFPAAYVGGETIEWAVVAASYNQSTNEFVTDAIPDTPEPFSSTGYPDDAATRFDAIFTVGPAVAVNGSYHHVVAGDWNGDGFDDLFLYGRGTAADSLRFAETDGSGFGPGRPVTISTSYDQVVAGDFDANGRDDLLFYGRGAKPDRMLLSNSAGAGFHNGPPLAIAGDYAFVVAGHFNFDGRTDLALYGTGTKSDRLYLTKSNQTFDRQAISIAGDYNRVAAGDFTGDGRSDLLLSAGDDPGRVWVRTSAGFTSKLIATGAGLRHLVTGDFDDDERADAFGYRIGSGIDRFVRGLPSGPPLASGPSVAVGSAYDGTVAGDFNGDGVSDLFFYGAGTHGDAFRMGIPHP